MRRTVGVFLVCLLAIPEVSLANPSVVQHTLCAQRCRIPILMYHYIRDAKKPKTKLGKSLSVSPTVLAAQLDVLRKAGYTTIRFGDLAEGKPLPEKPVILTFDDGYADAATAAYPALRERNMVGTFFIITGYVGRKNYLSQKQLVMLRDGGMELGTHTATHVNLAKTSPLKQREEIERSAGYLGELGVKPTVFAYPYGKYGASTVPLLEAAGIRYAVTTHSGIARESSDPLLLPRLRMTMSTKLASLLREVDRLPSPFP